MVAVNAQVVSRRTERQDGALTRFSADIRGIIDAAGRSVTVLQADLQAADAQLVTVSAGIRRMTDTVATLRELREELPRLLATLAEDHGLDRALGQVRKAHGGLVAALQAAVTELQCGDAVRQRLEHVAAMLARAGRADPSTAAAIHALARAQADAALADVGAAVQAVLPELDRIARARHAGMTEIGAVARSPAPAAMGRIARLAARIVAGLEQLDALHENIAPDMERLSELYARGAASAQEIADLESRMHHLGINAILVSSRIGTEGRAMTEVAHQLRECTGTIGRNTARIVHLARLQELNAVIFLAPTEKAAGGATGNAIRSLQAGATDLDALLDGLAAAPGTGEEDPLATARDMLTGFMAGSHLPRAQALAPPEAAERAVLDEIRATYTMQAERTLHDALFPPPDSSARPAAAAAGGRGEVFF
jgi:hypothetical protein